MGPSLGGLFAGGFPSLRPIGQRDLTVKTSGWWFLVDTYSVEPNRYIGWPIPLCLMI